MIMIICIHKKDTLQMMAKNKQQSPNLSKAVEITTQATTFCMAYYQRYLVR